MPICELTLPPASCERTLENGRLLLCCRRDDNDDGDRVSPFRVHETPLKQVRFVTPRLVAVGQAIVGHSHTHRDTSFKSAISLAEVCRASEDQIG